MQLPVLVVVTGLLFPVRASDAAPEDRQVPGLIDQLASGNPAERAKAAERLRAMGVTAVPPLLEAAAGENLALAVPARELLPTFGPAAIDTFIEVGSTDTYWHRTRTNEAMAAVARMGRPALLPILDIFTTANPARGRWIFAVGVLAQMGDLAVEPLIPLINHPTREVREEAATLLANFGDSRASSALMAGLDSGDDNVRAASARGLGRIGDRRAVEQLLGALRDPAMAVRMSAAGALGRVYERRFRERIARLARSDPEILVRDTAASALLRSTQDSVAVRLGRRYKPIDVSPARQASIALAMSLWLGLTAVVLIGLALTVVMALRKGLPWHISAPAIAAAAGGFCWGRVFQHLSGAVENGLLFVVVPAAALSGFLISKAVLKGEVRGLGARMAWVAPTVSFYAGYAAGWLALWGRFGV